MNYEEWLNNIEILKNKDDTIIKDNLLNAPINENLRILLEPKLSELIQFKLNKVIKYLKVNMASMYRDKNNLDMQLVTLRKKLKFIVDLTYIKEISLENQKELREILKEQIDSIYKILISGANEIDNIGLLGLTIKKNMYKMEEKNEL